MGSLLVANTVTGAASLMRRDLLASALPFPPVSGEAFHDHWLALCALASGEIGYLDEATYDHIRHRDSFTVREGFGITRPVGDTPHWRLRLTGALGRLRRRALRPGWRSLYFDRYLLAVQYAVTLRLRFGAAMDAGRSRPLRRVETAERTLSGPAWLAVRSLRPYLGRNETFARERVLLGAVFWRRLAGAMTRLRRSRV